MKFIDDYLTIEDSCFDNDTNLSTIIERSRIVMLITIQEDSRVDNATNLSNSTEISGIVMLIVLQIERRTIHDNYADT